MGSEDKIRARGGFYRLDDAHEGANQRIIKPFITQIPPYGALAWYFELA